MTELEKAIALKETHENDANVLRNHMEKISELSLTLKELDFETIQENTGLAFEMIQKLADDIHGWSTVNKNAKERLV